MLGRYDAAGLLKGMVQAGPMVVGAFERYEATGALPEVVVDKMRPQRVDGRGRQ